MNWIRRGFQYVELEALAFYHGTVVGFSEEAVKARIEAHFEQLKERTGRRFIDRIKRLEALVDTLARFRDEVGNVWQGFKAELNGRMPSLAAPLVVMLMGGCVAVGEAVMLAPMMDALAIADRILQHGASFMIAMILGGLFKPGFPFWPWHGHSIHPRCPEYHVFSR